MDSNNIQPVTTGTLSAPLSAPSETIVTQDKDVDSRDHHFRTDAILANLKNRTISGGFITASSQAVQFVLTLGSTMILARLLSPRDFGLVAMVWTVLGFLRIFKEAGLSTATVQSEGITHAQVSNLFWINVVISGFVSLLVAATSPLIARFYREPALVWPTVALSLTFLLAGLSAQNMALLNRQMRFKVIAFIQIASVLAGALAGIVMAWLKYRYWSLVGMNLATSIIALLMTWSASKWRPQFYKRNSNTRPLLHFGASLSAGAFFYSIARSLDTLLIGRFYGAISVGLYSRAAALLARPLEQFMGPIETVSISAFSRLQTQPERYRRTYLDLYEAIALTSMFFTGLFFALSHPLTLVVLGAKWEKAANIFAALSFAALQFPVGSCASWLLTSQGRGRDSFVAGSVSSLIVAASFAAGLPYGPLGVAWAYSASCLLIVSPVYFWLVGRRGPVRTSDLWIGLWKYIPVWAVVALVAGSACHALPDKSPLVQLLIAAPAGLLAGTAFIAVYPPARRTIQFAFGTFKYFVLKPSS